MKKVFTITAFFFAFSLSANAGAMYASPDPGTPSDEECTTSAWGYGSRQGDGNEKLEYFYTNWYYEVYCA